MRLFLLLLFFFSLSQPLAAQCPCQGTAELAPGFFLHWKILDDLFIVDVNLTALGWIGIGWNDENSVAGSMISADVIIAVFDEDGKGSVTDYWSTSFVTPSTDVSLGGRDDVLVSYAYQDFTANVSKLSFVRKLSTTDVGHDWNITDSEIYVIWAHGSQPGPLSYHGTNRGSVQINFFTGGQTNPPTNPPTNASMTPSTNPPTNSPTSATITPSTNPSTNPSTAPSGFNFSKNVMIAIIVAAISALIIVVNMIFGIVSWKKKSRSIFV